MPTLDEVLAVCRGKIDVLLDLKETGDDFRVGEDSVPIDPSASFGLASWC